MKFPFIIHQTDILLSIFLLWTILINTLAHLQNHVLLGNVSKSFQIDFLLNT